MIRRCSPADFTLILQLINSAAVAYKGVIPADRWKDPYMQADELTKQIEEGVQFWCCVEDQVLLGVMGIQDKGDVTLIRHAYVSPLHQKRGVGGKLLQHLTTLTDKSVLIGTWAAASWAIDFYLKHSFRVVGEVEKNFLLKKYWDIPERQVQTSVVLTNQPLKLAN
jgi:N-acetylglutamate synthase-like GNAT family acetyltransferase